MRKEPFLSGRHDDDLDLGVSKKGELLVNGETVQTWQQVSLSGFSLFLAMVATAAVCLIAFLMFYRTFVVPM